MKRLIAFASALLLATAAFAGPFSASAGSASAGTVTSASCTPSQGVTCTVGTATTTPAISVGLGAITPTSVSTGTVTTTVLSGGAGGSDTQLQYNNAGSFAGMAGTAWDNTNRSLVLTGATVTTSKPVFDLTQTWNSSGVTFTAAKVNVTNTASAAASLLQDWQVGGTSMASVRKDGMGTFGDAAGFNSPNLNLRFSSGAGAMIQLNGANAAALSSNFGFAALKFSLTSALTSSPDLFLERDAAHTLALRSSTNAQTSRIYNTYTDASNYERGFSRWASNVYEIGTESAGTGSARYMWLYTNGTVAAKFGNASFPGDIEWSKGGSHYFKGGNLLGNRFKTQPQSSDVTLSASTDYIANTVTNTGASGEVIATLGNTDGDNNCFAVTVAQYLRVKAPTGVTIYDGTSASASAGYIRSNAIGSTLCVRRVNTNIWMVFTKAGTWTVDS